jgi:hypothetical protein
MPTNREPKFVEAWGRRRVLGLPVRIVFAESWHRVHLGILCAGGICFWAGTLGGVGWLARVGIGLFMFPLACWAVALACFAIASVRASRPRS